MFLKPAFKRSKKMYQWDKVAPEWQSVFRSKTKTASKPQGKGWQSVLCIVWYFFVFSGPFSFGSGWGGFKVLGYALFLHLHIAASLLLFCSQGYARLCYCPLLFSFSGNERFGRFGCCCTFYKERRNAKICQTYMSSLES